MVIVLIFVVGYLAIAFEHSLKLNKAASALLTGVLCWTAHIARADRHAVTEALERQLADIAGILFFLLAAMVIVELVDVDDGFDLITTRIRTQSRRKLLLIVAILSFFLSAVLDNLTTSIVMISLVRKLIPGERDRMFYGGIVIVAANGGGVWSPIGDVTTTMLWIGGAITTPTIIQKLFLPAVVSVTVPLLWIGLRMKGPLSHSTERDDTALRRWVDEQCEKLSPETTTVAVELPPGAVGTGKSLLELNLRARTEASVLSIHREGASLASPSPRDPMRPGDVLHT